MWRSLAVFGHDCGALDKSSEHHGFAVSPDFLLLLTQDTRHHLSPLATACTPPSRTHTDQCSITRTGAIKREKLEKLMFDPWLFPAGCVCTCAPERRMRRGRAPPGSAGTTLCSRWWSVFASLTSEPWSSPSGAAPSLLSSSAPPYLYPAPSAHTNTSSQTTMQLQQIMMQVCYASYAHLLLTVPWAVTRGRTGRALPRGFDVGHSLQIHE